MAYQVIARKYRPQTFSDLVGQLVSVRTLQNAIRRNRTSHAYLFSGPRGVGKTTMARILAKALNCAQGPTPEPCGHCDACREIAQGTAMDVIEIDAASNRGIDEIRELRDGIQYGPARDRFKIFIIDEAHMLTDPAFNALLKTLEEPPAHAVFILATTEKQKIPITIVSRCQPFDFQLIATAEMAARIRNICQSEKLAISEKGIELIAIAGEGSLRDALSLLDQVVNYGGAELTDEDVAAVLGVVDYALLERTSTAVAEGNAEEILRVVGEVSDSGHDLQHFCRRLLMYFRNLMVCRAAGAEPGLLNVPESQIPGIKRASESFSVEDLVRFLDILGKTESEMRWAYYPRFHLEMSLLKLSYVPKLRPIAEVIAELKSGAEPLVPSKKTPPAAAPTPVKASARTPVATPPPAAPPSPATPPAAMPDDAPLDDRVAEFRKGIKERKPVLDSWLDAASSIVFEDSELRIHFSRKFSIQHEKLSEPENAQLLRSIGHVVFGVDTRLALLIDDKIVKMQGVADAAPKARSAGDDPLATIKKEPVVRSFLDHFPGKVSIEENET